MSSGNADEESSTVVLDQREAERLLGEPRDRVRALRHGWPTLIEIAADDVLREFGRK